MLILLTNDDGVNAPGLWALYKALTLLGDVVIVAPDSERSSVGHAITLNQPLFHKEVVINRGVKAHALSGTPADCVKFAMSVLKVKPDLIFSGINSGSNDGCSVFYSGTVAAAREGALFGVSSVAMSLDSFHSEDFSVAAQVGKHVAKWLGKNPLPQGTFLNVNVPEQLKEIKKDTIRWASQCPLPIHGEFKKRMDPFGRVYYWLTGRPVAAQKYKQTDTFLLKKKYVTITPVYCETTNIKFLNQALEQGETL